MSLKRKLSVDPFPNIDWLIYEVHDVSLGNCNGFCIGSFTDYTEAYTMAKEYFDIEIAKVFATNIAFGEVIYDPTDINIIIKKRFKL